jgi:hypothetical protein
MKGRRPNTDKLAQVARERDERRALNLSTADDAARAGAAAEGQA